MIRGFPCSEYPFTSFRALSANSTEGKVTKAWPFIRPSDITLICNPSLASLSVGKYLPKTHSSSAGPTCLAKFLMYSFLDGTPPPSVYCLSMLWISSRDARLTLSCSSDKTFLVGAAGTGLATCCGEVTSDRDSVFAGDAAGVVVGDKN